MSATAPRRWQQLPGKLNLRVSHPGVTAERWAALSEPKVLHFAHHPKPWIAWLGAHRGDALGPAEAAGSGVLTAAAEGRRNLGARRGAASVALRTIG